MSSKHSVSSFLLVAAIIAPSITAIADSEVLLVAQSDSVLALNPADGSDADNSLPVKNVVRVASNGRGGFVAATWNGTDSALLAFDTLGGNFAAKTIIPNHRMEALALNLSDNSAIYSSGSAISSVVIGEPSEPKVELTEAAVAIAYDHCNHSRLIYANEGSGTVIEILDGNNKSVASISNLTRVRAIAVDPWSGLIYWIDKTGRREFRLERADRDGNGRQAVCQRVADQNPFDLSVGKDHIAWSDWHNNAVWKMDKHSGSCEPEVLRRFSLARPMGIDFMQRPHSCSDRENIPQPEQSVLLPEPPLPNPLSTPSLQAFKKHQEKEYNPSTESTPSECFYFWAFVIAVSVASMALVVVLCLGVAFYRLRRRRSPVVISKRRPSGVRSFTNNVAAKKSTEETLGARSCGRDGAVVDLEDCCHMTLCETPCVEATFRKTTNRRDRKRGKPSVSIMSSPAKSDSVDEDRDGLIQNEEHSDNDMDW